MEAQQKGTSLNEKNENVRGGLVRLVYQRIIRPEGISSIIVVK